MPRSQQSTPKRKKQKGPRWIHDFSCCGNSISCIPRRCAFTKRVGLVETGRGPKRHTAATKLPTPTSAARVHPDPERGEMGVNLAGIEIILTCAKRWPEMQHQMEAFTTFVQQEIVRGLKSVPRGRQQCVGARLPAEGNSRGISEDVNRALRDRDPCSVVVGTKKVKS